MAGMQQVGRVAALHALDNERNAIRTPVRHPNFQVVDMSALYASSDLRQHNNEGIVAHAT